MEVIIHQPSNDSFLMSDRKRPSETFWGVSTCVDLYDCDPGMIRDAQTIRNFVAELIVYIDMKAFGPCHVVHFGQDPKVEGFSMFQLIETSCISGHFSNQSSAAYLDIFSCKFYSVEKAAAFSKDFFQAKCWLNQMLKYGFHLKYLLFISKYLLMASLNIIS